MILEVYEIEWFVWRAFCCLCMLLWHMFFLTVCERDAHHIGRYLCYMSKLLLDQMKEQLVAVTVTLPVCFL